MTSRQWESESPPRHRHASGRGGVASGHRSCVTESRYCDDMTQTHDMPTLVRRALQLDVYVADASTLLDEYDPPREPWDLSDALIDRLATICRDTEWSPDAFGAYDHPEQPRTIIEAYGDGDPSDLDQQLVLDALDALSIDVHSHVVVDAVGT